jgi:hypothetical protein
LIDVVIGYDSRETVAAHVLAHSIDRHCSETPMFSLWRLERLKMWRERDPNQSTEFAYSRFLVPYKRGFRGWSIFLDCDMLCRWDFAELLDLAQKNDQAVSVVQHAYTPKHTKKFLDQPQTVYEKKNWSSVMVFNNEKCQKLTPEYVNTASGLELHQFKWTDEVGSLPTTWNHLVGEYDPNPNAKLVHFTLGTPCFRAYEECEFAKEWFEEERLMRYRDPYKECSKPERVEP